MANKDGIRYVALLRAVNVGGVKVSMRDLARLCEELGWNDVRTHANSGNVRFDTRASRTDVVASLEDALGRELGREVRVVVRTQPELADAAARCEANRHPTDEPKMLHIGFCDTPPPIDAFADADWDRVAPDTATVSGSELLLRYPKGVGRSKMTQQWLLRHIGADRVLTVRGLSMVRRLAEL